MENLLLVYQVLIDLLLCTQGGGAKQNCQEPWPHGAAILEDGAEINKRVNNLTLHGAVLGGEWSRAVGQETLLRSLLETNEIPSLILWGPPGCGKVSAALPEPCT